MRQGKHHFEPLLKIKQAHGPPIVYRGKRFVSRHFRRSYLQELSYRKQIARKLRTQYVEGIDRPKYYTVTLKCGLEVTQGH